MKALVLSVMIVLGFAACSTLKGMAQKPKLSFKNIDVKGLSFSGVNLVARFEVENPNGFDIKIDKVNYGLKINDRDFATAEVSEKIEIEGRETATFELPVSIKYTDLIRTIKEFGELKKAQFLLAGSVSSGPFTVPFQEKGELEIPDLKLQ